MKEVYLVEKCQAKKDPFPCFATSNEVFAIEEMERLNKERKDVCFYRVTPVKWREYAG